MRERAGLAYREAWLSHAALVVEAAKGMFYEDAQDFALVQRFVDELSLFGFAGDSLCFVVGSMKVLALTVVLLLGPTCFSQSKPATATSPQQTSSTDQQTAATVQNPIRCAPADAADVCND
jgi:hypothetical protein